MIHYLPIPECISRFKEYVAVIGDAPILMLKETVHLPICAELTVLTHSLVGIPTSVLLEKGFRVIVMDEVGFCEELVGCNIMAALILRETEKGGHLHVVRRVLSRFGGTRHGRVFINEELK